MTPRMLTAMFVLSSSVLLGAQADDLFVNDPRPIKAMAEKIEIQTGWTITYEDPSYQYAADIEDISAEVPDPSGKPFPSMRHVPFVFTLDADTRKDAVRAARALADNFEMRTGGQKFKVIAEKGYIHLVPQVNRDKSGAWTEQKPMLDTRIAIAAGKRSLADFLTEFKQAVTQASGRNLYIGAMPMGLMMNTEIELAAFKNAQARDVLREALSLAPAKLSWQLLGGVGDEDQFLSVHVTGTAGKPE